MCKRGRTPGTSIYMETITCKIPLKQLHEIIRTYYGRETLVKVVESSPYRNNKIKRI